VSEAAASAANEPGRPRITLIAAVARNGVIGRDNALLWHLPEDMRHFRAVTSGHPVIMGRKTWESLPPRFRPLPGRRNIVVTRQPAWQADGAKMVASPEAALALLSASDHAFVIGGAELYAAMLPWADELLLTEIDRDFDGDVFFPAWDGGRFVEASRQTHAAAAPNDFGFSFARYRRSARG
jgi:dihydrofolate reductase